MMSIFQTHNPRFQSHCTKTHLFGAGFKLQAFSSTTYSKSCPIRTREGPHVTFKSQWEDKMTLGDKIMLQVSESCNEKTPNIP